MGILNPIFRLFIKKQAVKQTGKIPPADTVLDLNAANLQKRLQSMGIDTSKIKNTKEIEQALNIEKSRWNQQIKQATEAAPKGILKPTKKKEKPFTGWTPRVVEKSMPADDYYALKEEWFGRIIANTDDAINTWLKKGIDAADERFVGLSKSQRKDFLDMVQYRLKHGNVKFMDDSQMFFKEPKAYGGIAGMLGEPTYQDDNHRVPLKGGKLALLQGLGKILDDFFPGTTKIGKTSKPMADKTELKRSIAGFQERENIAKELKSFRGQIDDNIIKEISAMEPAQQLKAIEEVKFFIKSRKNLKQDLMLRDLDVTGKKGHATGGVAGMLGE